MAEDSDWVYLCDDCEDPEVDLFFLSRKALTEFAGLVLVVFLLFMLFILFMFRFRFCLRLMTLLICEVPVLRVLPGSGLLHPGLLMQFKFRIFILFILAVLLCLPKIAVLLPIPVGIAFTVLSVLRVLRVLRVLAPLLFTMTFLLMLLSNKSIEAFRFLIGRLLLKVLVELAVAVAVAVAKSKLLFEFCLHILIPVSTFDLGTISRHISLEILISLYALGLRVVNLSPFENVICDSLIPVLTVLLVIELLILDITLFM